MCGITGYFSLDNSLVPARFAAATSLIDYRGPDDFGYVSCSRTGKITEYHDEALKNFASDQGVLGALGFRRLAILDLSTAGHQPMGDATRNFWILFNGEVYNYLEIRSELIELGYSFKSNSDTEVILTAYCHWGQACLEKFNGMWALAILDVAKQKLFCARDRFGIKPFNFYLDNKKFIFGSESKQIQCMLGRSLEPDSRAAFDYLIFGAKNHTENTFFSDIKELRGGECMQVDLSDGNTIRVRREKWWTLQQRQFEGDAHEAAEQMLHLLKDSIRIRLRSDVPTGTALSGGLDSNGVVALTDELSDQQQDVFTVVSNDKNLDESEFAEKSVKKYGLKSHKIDFSTQDIKTLEKITFHHDQPLSGAGNVGGWILQQLIQSTNIIVNLNGQGADELMGGYSRPPHALTYLDSLHSGRLVHAHQQLLKGFQHSNRSLPGSLSVFGTDIARVLFRNAAYKSVLGRRKAMLNAEFFHDSPHKSAYIDIFKTDIDFSSLQKKHAWFELQNTSLPSLLHNVDRDSMAHSLEARVPFLDYRIAEHIFSLPPAMLLHDGFTKYTYRKAMQGRIDDELLWNNNKKGFVTPVNDYLVSGHAYCQDLLQQFPHHPVLNMDWVKSAFAARDPRQSRFLWRCLCFLIWDRQRIQGSYSC